MKPTPTPEVRLKTLIADIEKAEGSIRAGRKVDMRAMDAESLALHKFLKAKPDAALQPLLMKAITALERLTAALEDQLQVLKTKKN